MTTRPSTPSGTFLSFEDEEIPIEKRFQNVYEAWLAVNGTRLQRSIVKLHGVLHSTFSDRIAWKVPRKIQHLSY